MCIGGKSAGLRGRFLVGVRIYELGVKGFIGGLTTWLAPEKNGEKDLQLSFSEFKQICRAWGKLREITF